jgi:predicted dehydrogenase
VVGCGFQGEALLAALHATEGVHVAGVCDLDERRLQAVGARFGILELCRDPAELLSHRPDLMCICTMPNTHRDLGVQAFAAGSHVFCEKPLAMSTREAVEMVCASRAANRLLMVGFNMRFMGGVAAIRQFAAGDFMGDFVCGRGFMLEENIPWWGKHYVRSMSGGGALASTSVHMLDLLMWLAGNPTPLTATASMATVFPRKRSGNAPPGAAGVFDVEDVVSGHVRYEGGFWISVDGAWNYDRSGYTYGFDLLGTKGQAHLAPLELYTEREGAACRVFPNADDAPDFAGALQDEVRDIIDAVRHGRHTDRLATGDQALQVQTVTDALYRSSAEGREVRVERPWDRP